MQSLDQFISKLATEIINPLILAMFAIALLFVLWGVYEYVRDAASDTNRKKAQQKIIYGVVGMVFMMSVFGVMRLALSTFNISDAPLQGVRKGGS